MPATRYDEAYARVETPEGFDGPHHNVRYFLARSNDTIILYDLCHPEPVASFHPGRTERLNPYIAWALLGMVVRVQLENQTVRLHLRYGPGLAARR